MLIENFRNDLKNNKLDKVNLIKRLDTYGEKGKEAQRKIEKMEDEFEKKVAETKGRIDINALNKEMSDLIIEIRRIETVLIREAHSKLTEVIREEYNIPKKK